MGKKRIEGPFPVLVVPALGFLVILALGWILLIPATGWGDNCSSCHTDARRLKALVSPPPPSLGEEGEG